MTGKIYEVAIRFLTKEQAEEAVKRIEFKLRYATEKIREVDV